MKDELENTGGVAVEGLLIWPRSRLAFQVAGADGAVLLTVHPDGRVEAPSIEAANEAGRVFVESARDHLAADRIESKLEKAREALAMTWEALGAMTVPDGHPLLAASEKSQAALKELSQ